MANKGKYHGQRLRAQDVLRLYAAGERDFRGVNLRGQSFRGADLSGADFSGADIRSARFVDSKLQSVKFCAACGGLQKRWFLVQMILVIIVATLVGFLQGFAGESIALHLYQGSIEETLAGFVGLLVVATTFVAIAHQGFTLKTLGSITIAIAIAIAVAFTVAVAFTTRQSAFTQNTSVYTFTVAVAVTAAFVDAIVTALANVSATILTAIISIVAAVAVGLVGQNTETVAVAGATTGGSIGFLFSLYINHHIRQNTPKFEGLRTIGLAFSTIGGTNFSGADLTEAFFTKAVLNRVIFANSRQQSTITHHTRWHQATYLDRARLGSIILKAPRVRNLLTTLNGNNQNLSYANLEGANLADAQLRNANLCGARLSRATLQNAALHNINLTEAQCIGTNFMAAQLTGATLEAWSLDNTTILTNTECQYVFLKENPDHLGNRERLPHNPDKIFKAGDFEKYFKEVMDEVKLLIRDGIEPQAFKMAFQSLIGKHDISSTDVRGFERKGSDILIRVAVPPHHSKEDIARTFDANYEKALPVSKAEALLEAEHRSKQEIIQLANKSIDSISTVLSNLTINTTAMTNSNNPNITTGDGSFYAAGDVNLTGSTLNLGEISGQVTTQINQLPAAETGQPDLKDLLAQLQAAIEQDTELSDDEKAEALGEVAKLAKAGATPKEGKMQNLAKRATTTLKAIAETLTDTSKLATTCKTLLPMIVALF
ncbi:MAG: pentapeptide repeat-containing protein [Leptolyngbya sp. SIO3F4]|nr:pentapeptide repeat-containing protein [Leptolyngbya sp. SIO3F4]